ncbi:MAG TPA: PaaI family thioesterase [Granulicella sp.]|jgi:acyl-coenzyme A thioesterase PaaI-like protein|nr:PaaI family thioesterase [Granulicella sp.]
MTDPTRTAESDHAPNPAQHHCFGCGVDNPHGLHLRFTLDPDAQTATAPVHLDRHFEGPPGHIHGGIIATLMDEAMSKVNRLFGVLAMTRHMEVDYLRPAPLHQNLVLVGHHTRREGRKLFHRAELLNQEGVVLAKAKGLFVAVDPALIDAAKAAGRI